LIYFAIIPHAAEVTSVELTRTTPVVPALVKGSKAACDILGKTKIKGGIDMNYVKQKMEMDPVFFH